MFIQEDLKAPTTYSVVRNDELLEIITNYRDYLQGLYSSPMVQRITSTTNMMKLSDKILTLNKRIDSLKERLQRNNNTYNC